MASGTVKWFNSTKGFGFFEPKSNGSDTFVHVSALEGLGLSTLAGAQKVTFGIESGQDGHESSTNLALV